MTGLNLMPNSKAVTDISAHAGWPSPTLKYKVTVWFTDGTKEVYVCNGFDWFSNCVILRGQGTTVAWNSDFVSHVREEIIDDPNTPGSCSNPS